MKSFQSKRRPQSANPRLVARQRHGNDLLIKPVTRGRNPRRPASAKHRRPNSVRSTFYRNIAPRKVAAKRANRPVRVAAAPNLPNPHHLRNRLRLLENWAIYQTQVLPNAIILRVKNFWSTSSAVVYAPNSFICLRISMISAPELDKMIDTGPHS